MIEIFAASDLGPDDEYDVYIIDEAEQVIYDYSCLIKNSSDLCENPWTSRGLIRAYHSNKVYFMTAQFGNLDKDILYKVWGIASN